MIKIKKTVTQEEFSAGVEALTSIFIDEYPYYSTWIHKNMDQFNRGEKQILAVLDENDLLGYIMIHFCSEHIVKINGIYIFENNKGKGIATQALIELTNMLKNLGVKLIFVQTRLDNNAVVHLFDKTNFKLVGTNYHEVEQKDNWVACNNINSININEQEVASEIYDGFSALSSDEIEKLRFEHKDGNLVLTRKKEDKKE